MRITALMDISEPPIPLYPTNPDDPLTVVDLLAVERFWRRVAVKGPDKCWPWLLMNGTPDSTYGSFHFRGRRWPSHRFAYFAWNGEIPAAAEDYSSHGTVVRHRCDNPACCNPDHLIPGSQADNIRDRGDRKREADRRGEKHPRARLSAVDVRYIRECGRPTAALAEFFGVTPNHVRAIRDGKAWGHLR